MTVGRRGSAWALDEAKINNNDPETGDWGDVDKTALGNALAKAYAAGDVTRANIREAYAYVPDDAFSTNDDGPTFTHTKAWGPHHTFSGDTIRLHRGGVHAAAQALAGARAKPAISAEAQASARRHVRRHYGHLDEPPPESLGEVGPHRSGRFTEHLFESPVTLEEAQQGKPRYVGGWGITADVVNANGRCYPEPVLIAAVERAQAHLHESAGSGRLVYLVLGEAEHPDRKRGRPEFLETIVRWTELAYDPTAKRTRLRGRLIETAAGKDALAIMEAGVLPALSQRAYGTYREEEVKGQPVHVIEECDITGYDLLAPGEQSDPHGGIVMLEQMRSRIMDEKEKARLAKEKAEAEAAAAKAKAKLDEAKAAAAAASAAAATGPQTAEQIMAQRPEVAKAIVEMADRERQLTAQAAQVALDEEKKLQARLMADREKVLRANLELDETADLDVAIAELKKSQAALLEEKNQAAVAEYIEAQVSEMKYPATLQKQLIEAVTALEPASIDEAKQVLVARRKEYDAIMAEFRLSQMGMMGGRVIGPVLEQETGYPAFAEASFILTESLVRASNGRISHPPQAGGKTPLNTNQWFTLKYLQRFDEMYQHHLVREAQTLREAVQTSDLSLPYSVARTIIAAATAQLVATSIFDVDTITASPTRLFFDSYTADTGLEVSIIDEAVTSDESDWVAMAHKRITPGTVVVEPSGGGTAFVEGTDYLVDYIEGRFYTLPSPGTIGDSTALDVDYAYVSVREGEMSVIQRAKRTITFLDVSASADRLATQITREAIVFSRSQLGLDIVSRTLGGLITEIAELIDTGILWTGLNAALILASNSGGAWAEATDDLELLVQYIGEAKVLVANRHYTPDFVLMSVSNSDTLSNSERFTQAGSRPDGSLNPNGYVGMVKGLPCFQTTQFSDSYILVGSRQLVMHRVFQPLTLMGPYISTDATTAQLIAAEQYYTEEFNVTVAPIEEKGSWVGVS